MRGVIYKYTNIVNNKVYIGQTINEKKRREKWNNLSTPYAGKYINRARLKYGLESFKYEILAEIISDNEDVLKDTLNKLEIRYISMYNSKNSNYGYNLSDGGIGGNGQIVSEETRAKLRARRGIKKKPMSEEGKRNISKSHKGPRPWRWKKVAQYDKDTGELIRVWNSLTEVINYFGVKSTGNLYSAINKKNRMKTYKGYRWEYYGTDDR